MTAFRFMPFVFGLLVIAPTLQCGGDAPDDSHGKKDAKNKNKPTGGKRWVTGKNGLNMRRKPSVKGRRILTLPHNARVKVLERRERVVEFYGHKGHWTRVQWMKYKGWVFGYYLVEQPHKFSEGDKAFISPQLERLATGLEVRIRGISAKGDYTISLNPQESDKPAAGGQTVESHELTLTPHRHAPKYVKGCYQFTKESFPAGFSLGKIRTAACQFLRLRKDGTMGMGGHCHGPQSETYQGRWRKQDGMISFKSRRTGGRSSCSENCSFDYDNDTRAKTAKCVRECLKGLREDTGRSSVNIELKGTLSMNDDGTFQLVMESRAVNSKGPEDHHQKTDRKHKCMTAL